MSTSTSDIPDLPQHPANPVHKTQIRELYDEAIKKMEQARIKADVEIEKANKRARANDPTLPIDPDIQASIDLANSYEFKRHAAKYNFQRERSNVFANMLTLASLDRLIARQDVIVNQNNVTIDLLSRIVTLLKNTERGQS